MPKVIGVFAGSETAEAANRGLLSMGLSEHDISLVFPAQAGHEAEEEEESDFPQLIGSDVAPGLTGWLGGGLLAVPGAGTYLGIGPLVLSISNAFNGNLEQALEFSGIHKDRAGHYAGSLERGRVLAVVEPRPGDEERVAGLLREYGAQDVEIH